MLNINTVCVMDALEWLSGIPSGSVDAVITDPPWGGTGCDWDTPPEWPVLMPELKRIIKPRGRVILFGQMPYAINYFCHKPLKFSHMLTWVKNIACGHLNAKRAPLRQAEQIFVFNPGYYSPQLIYTEGVGEVKPLNTPRTSRIYGARRREMTKTPRAENERLITDVIFCDIASRSAKNPTAKPLPLCELLLRVYTPPEGMIVDPFCGCGSVLAAARATGRHYAGCDLCADFVAEAKKSLTTNRKQRKTNACLKCRVA